MGALRSHDDHPGQPTAWLAEGLLMYLPADAQDRLFENIGALSAAGSRIAAETAGTQSDEHWEQLRERFERVCNELGIAGAFDIQDLIYNDPDRAELAGWLADHGWQATSTDSTDEMRRLGRLVDVPFTDGRGMFSNFVVAQRL